MSGATTIDTALAPGEPGTVGDPRPALARLEASRRRLQHSIVRLARPNAGRATSQGIGSRLAAAARRVPGMGVLLDGVLSWWRRQPLHAAGVVAADLGSRYVEPMIRRRPWPALILAALGGIVTIRYVRPWRWLLRPAFMAGVASDVALHALRSAPLAAWLGAGSIDRHGSDGVANSHSTAQDWRGDIQ
jgi:hypothetical protein